jgi:hypothetical protein
MWPQPKNATFTEIYLITIRSYSYLVDFLTMITLLYLFYSQGILHERQLAGGEQGGGAGSMYSTRGRARKSIGTISVASGTIKRRDDTTNN